MSAQRRTQQYIHYTDASVFKHSICSRKNNSGRILRRPEFSLNEEGRSLISSSKYQKSRQLISCRQSGRNYLLLVAWPGSMVLRVSTARALSRHSRDYTKQLGLNFFFLAPAVYECRPLTQKW